MQSYTIGIDLGGTNLRVAAYGPHSDPHAHSGHSVPSTFLTRWDRPTRVSDGPGSVIEEIIQMVRGIDAVHPTLELSGVGIGTPGPLELPTGILHAPPNLPGWDQFHLRASLEATLDCPVFLESDANLAALAEFACGAGKAHQADSLCMLTLGTGVGHAMVLGGQLWSGIHGMAGEAGHTTVWPDGPACACGNRGCLELYASATGVRRAAEEAAASGAAPGLLAWQKANGALDAQAVYQLATAGDPDALRIYHVVGTALGIALGSLVNTLDIRLYVLGGGLTGAWDLFSPIMFREMESRSYVYRLVNQRLRTRRIEVVPASLGSDAGLLGAALLPNFGTP